MGKSRFHSFNSNDKSDEEIVSTSKYPFNLDTNTLLGNSPKTRRAKKLKKTGTGNPPRPQNAFFLYRRDKMASPEFKNRPANEKRARIVSKEISKLWNNESMETQEVFYALARMSEQLHAKTYVNYRFTKKSNKLPTEDKLSMSFLGKSSTPTSTPTTTPSPSPSPIPTPSPLIPPTLTPPIPPIPPPPPPSYPLCSLEIPTNNYTEITDNQFFLVGYNTGNMYFLDINEPLMVPVNIQLTYEHTEQ
jgi:hypothetical protein